MQRLDPSSAHDPLLEPHFAMGAPVYPEGLPPPHVRHGPERGRVVGNVGWALFFASSIGILALGLGYTQPLRLELGHAQEQVRLAQQQVAMLTAQLDHPAQAPSPQPILPSGPTTMPAQAAAQHHEASQALRSRLSQALDLPMARGHVTVHQDELTVVLRLPADVATGPLLPAILRAVAQALPDEPELGQGLHLEARLLGTPPVHRRGRDVFAARLATLVRALDATWHHQPEGLHWHVALGDAAPPWGGLELRLITQTAPGI